MDKQNTLLSVPEGYRFVKVFPTTRLSGDHWWRRQGVYTRVYPHEYGKTVAEARKKYDVSMSAGYFVADYQKPSKQ